MKKSKSILIKNQQVMSIRELESIKKLFTELGDYLALNYDNSIINSYAIVKDVITVLNSNQSKEFKVECVINAYKSLYTGRAGLTEYYIWDNDYDTRMKLNEPLERIRNKLWEIMKSYI